jgi:hypothetical protein
VATTTICILGLRKETVGRINPAVAPRALSQHSSTLYQQNASRTDERI